MKVRKKDRQIVTGYRLSVISYLFVNCSFNDVGWVIGYLVNMV